MISQKMMVSSGKDEPWTFTVDTRLLDSSGTNKKSSIPFSLYNQTGTLNVEWGDGTRSRLTSSNYTVSSSNASVHEYSRAGVYTVTVRCKTWASIHKPCGIHLLQEDHNPFQGQRRRETARTGTRTGTGGRYRH